MTDRLEDVRAAIEPLLAPLDIELVDVEVVGSGNSRTLRVTIDRDGGVDLDTITAANEVISPVLDRFDPVSGSYTLEVSSPGVERPLRRPEDFVRHIGTAVSVKTLVRVDGARRYHGSIVSVDDVSFTIESEVGTTRTFSFEEVVQVRTVFEWEQATKRPSRSAPESHPRSGIKEKAGR